MKIAMYGGTFNPIHLGHMHAATAVAESLRLDKLLLMPAGIPPHKVLPEGSATPAQRLEMCRIAAGYIPRAEACPLELERVGASYTVDTLEELKRRHPEADLWLVVGTDMVLTFDKWREPEKMAKLCRLAVVARDESDRQRITQKAEALRQNLGLGIDLVDCPALPMSSTQVRETMDESLLHPAVLEYIRQNRLYLPSPEHLRAEVEKRVSPKRMAHILGCERMAAKMAEKYGVDDYTVRAAAILHDCTKALSEKEQLTLCEKWNIIIDYDEDNFAQLIHADTGAEVARREFKMPEDIVSAIRTHTTGDVSMTDLQKILYVADMCEETRTWPGVEELRALALTDLEGAVTSAMERTAAFIREQGREPYYKTLDALKLRKLPVETEETI
ncbi:MAG: nicotinate (nicotinamide) nucleotide adenylyltransferase [Clostridia bacterium]|nr:nicotinate (nicotinamide) nucleotide adenylyltransferase [Clostridia bacterium]